MGAMENRLSRAGCVLVELTLFFMVILGVSYVLNIDYFRVFLISKNSKMQGV